MKLLCIAGPGLVVIGDAELVQLARGPALQEALGA